MMLPACATADPEPATLDLVLRQDPGRLRVGYRVRNRTGGRLGVFDRPPDAAAYVDLDGRDLVIERLVPPLPADLGPAERVAPLARPLEPGGTLDGEIELDLPVEVHAPYRQARLAARTGAPVRADSLRRADHLILRIGVFRAAADWRFIETATGPPPLFRIWPPGPPADGQVVLEARAALAPALPVLDYPS